MSDVKAFNVLALTNAIAFALADGWTLKQDPTSDDPGDRDRHLFRASIVKDGAELLCYRHYGDTRLTISGQFPDQYRPYGEKHSITADPTKPAARIAADIKGR